MLNKLIMCLWAVEVLFVVEGDSLRVLVDNSVFNCTEMGTLTLRGDLVEQMECGDNVTSDQSRNNLPSQNETVSSTRNVSHRSQAPNQTSQQPIANIPDWYVIFQRVDYATRGFCLPIATLLGFIGNVLFFITLCKGYVQSNSYVYLLGLVSSNLMHSVFYSPTFLRAHKTITILRSYQALYAVYISYFYPLAFIVQTSGIWVTLLFTIERFVAVTFPLKAQRYFTVKRSRIAVCSAFGFGVALNFVRFFRRKVIRKVDPLTGQHYYSYTLTELAQNKSYDAITFWSYLLFNDVIPFLLLLIFNTLIIHRVWRARSTRREIAGKQKAEDNENSSREHQITRLLIAIVFGFLLCNLLTCVGTMYTAVNSFASVQFAFNPFVYYTFSLGTTFNRTVPLVNCILYAVCNDAMRNGILSVILRRKPVKTGFIQTTQNS